VLLIPGTSSAAHLEQNMNAGRIALDDDDLAALDGVGR
jgi:pyridoxine 4-dehydrogenase